MPTPDCSIRPVVRSQGPEWAVFCDDAYLDQPGCLGTAQRSALGGASGDDAYKTVLQVLDVSAEIVSMEPLAATPARSAQPRSRPPAQPGDKPREYPHSSGDRNTFPPSRHPDKGTQRGGSQRVAPTDLPGRRQPDPDRAA